MADNPWGWARDRFDGLSQQEQIDTANGAGADSANSGGLLDVGADGQAPSPGLSLRGQADSGAPEQIPLGYVSRAEAGPPPALVDPDPPVLRYSNGGPVIDPNTGSPYPLPPGMDVSKNAKGRANILDLPNSPDGLDPKGMMMASQFVSGRPQDYQRPDGWWAAKLFGDYNGDYRNVTAYNLGTVAAKAGYSLQDTLNSAGFYNQNFGKPKPGDTEYGVQLDAVKNITQGWNDAGRW